MELDTLIAELGPDTIARFRRPLIDRQDAERLLDELLALRSSVSRESGAASAVMATAATPPRPRPQRSDEPDDSADRSDRVRELRAAARRVTGGQRPVRARPVKDRDTVDHVTDPFLDQERGPTRREGKRPVPHSALLRPPSRPLPRISMPSAPPAPQPEAATDSPTRAAMGALFEDDDSTGGLVFLGGSAGGTTGFGPQPGTDPATAPLPAGGASNSGDATDVASAIERTADELERTADAPERSAPEPQLAGAEEPMPMDVPAAPFGFGPGDAEQTRIDRRTAQSTPPERHAPAHLSEEVVVSSVRKLFRR